jgi:hypothetical protein
MVVRYQHATPERNQTIANALDGIAMPPESQSDETDTRPFAPVVRDDARHCPKKPPTASESGGPPGSRSRHLRIKSAVAWLSLLTGNAHSCLFLAVTFPPVTMFRDVWPGVVVTL